MFGREPKIDAVKLQEAKLNVLDRLLKADPEEPQYESLLSRLNEIEELQSKDKQQIDLNSLIASGATVVGILIIVGYEHAHASASKAFSFVPKPR